MTFSYDELKLLLSWVDFCIEIGDVEEDEIKLRERIINEIKRLDDKYKDVNS